MILHQVYAGMSIYRLQRKNFKEYLARLKMICYQFQNIGAINKFLYNRGKYKENETSRNKFQGLISLPFKSSRMNFLDASHQNEIDLTCYRVFQPKILYLHILNGSGQYLKCVVIQVIQHIFTIQTVYRVLCNRKPMLHKVINQ